MLCSTRVQRFQLTPSVSNSIKINLSIYLTDNLLERWLRCKISHRKCSPGCNTSAGRRCRRRRRGEGGRRCCRHDMAKGRFHTSKTSNLSTSGQVKCFNLTNISAAHTHTHTHLVSVSLLTSSLCPHSTTISIYYGWCVSGFWVFAVNIYVSQWVALALDGTHTNTCTHMYLCRWAHTHTQVGEVSFQVLCRIFTTLLTLLYV